MPTPDLGPCCICQRQGPTVQNILMLNRRAPEPGTGWGCVVCLLPADGAVAVVCNACLEAPGPPVEERLSVVCSGSLTAHGRVSLSALPAETLAHDPVAHAADAATVGRVH